MHPALVPHAAPPPSWPLRSFVLGAAVGFAGLLGGLAINDSACDDAEPRAVAVNASSPPSRTGPASLADDLQHARMTVHAYAFEAYPRWAAEHPDERCPSGLTYLWPYLPRISQELDPWGTRYMLACHDFGLLVWSLGPDRLGSTPDDIRSHP